jgi:Plasmid pRiA4b ORF-3-like protein
MPRKTTHLSRASQRIHRTLHRLTPMFGSSQRRHLPRDPSWTESNEPRNYAESADPGCLTDEPVAEIVPDSPPVLIYLYDFGDDWEHLLAYEGEEPFDESVTYPRCLSGARRCPPEDCGGVHAYEDFLRAISDPAHPEHSSSLTWAGGPRCLRPDHSRFRGS